MPNNSPAVPKTASRTPRLAWILWTVGVLAYVTAVLHRTSFGVAGLDAADRFGASAGILSAFTVLQVLVYAGLQIPVGVVLDRIGPRKMVAGGALLMALGQLLMAYATGIWPAVLARILVGAGDAMTFISVLSVVNAWFPARRVPVITQMTGLLGQLGQLLSAIPLVALLHGPGWTTAFTSAAALGILMAVLSLAVLRDARETQTRTLHEVGDDLVEAWSHPGNRLGLWSHFVTQFSANAFALMWGFPYLVSGQGLSSGTASALLTVFVITTIVSGPLVGRFVAKHPWNRSTLVLTITILIVTVWTVVLLIPAQSPLWLLTLLVVVIALGGPGSMIGFDYARTFNPPDKQGTATGIINTGGFTAALVTILAVGFVLDALSPTATFTPEAFRWAWTVQYPLWLLGILAVLRTRKAARREFSSQTPPPTR